MGQQFASVEEYVASLPPAAAAPFAQARAAIHKALPGAQEAISYQILGFQVGGRPVVYLAGWKQHISIYPLPAGDAALEQRLAPYRSGQSTGKFPLNQPLPLDLIAELVRRLAAAT